MVKLIETIADLVPDDRNANRGTARGRDMVEHSLQRFGAGRSILVDRNGKIIAGNTTTEAAVSIGLDGVQVVKSDGRRLVVVQRTDLDLDTDAQARAMSVADNRTSEVGLDWEPDVLAALVEADNTALDGLFVKEEIDALLAGLTTDEAAGDDPGAQMDRADELRQKWQTERGQLWEIGRHRLLCGDSTEGSEVKLVLAGERADMVFTDPPYGVNVSGKGGDAIEGDISFTAIPLMFDILNGVLADGAWCYVCGGQSNMLLYARMFERYFRQLPRVVVWDKGRTAVLRHNGYHSCYEFVYFAFREGGGSRWFSGRDSDNADDLWRVSTDADKDRDHPTQKPVELPARAMRNTCPPNGLVFEPFAGAGATLVAAEQTGRRCYAMEIEPKYVAVTLERLAGMGLEPRRVNDA